MGYRIDWIGNNAIISLEGRVNFSDISDIDEKLYADPRFGGLQYQIWDFTQIEKLVMSSPEASILGVLDRNSSVWKKQVKMAMVTGEKEIIELIREYEKELKGTNWLVGIFGDLETARNWCAE